MPATIKKLPKSEVEISVEVPVADLKPFLEKAAQKISQQIKIEGFRPGKASYEAVKAKVGEAAILEEALDSIISATYFQALKAHNLLTISQPQIKVEKAAPNNPVVYQATAAILPEVKVGDYRQLSLQREAITIDDKKVDAVLEQIRNMRAKEELVKRPAAAGDRLEIDFDVFLDKVPIENGSQKKYPLTIGENRFIPGFEERLIGLSADDSKEFELRFPDQYFEKKLAGKAATFRVKCLAVYERRLPELNDALAQEVSGGKFKTLAELKDNIKKNLTEEETEKQERKMETEMINKIIGLSEFGELPAALVHNEIHKMMHELEDNLAGQGLRFEDYLSSLNKTRETLEKDLEPEAANRAQAALLLRSIYQTEKMSVDDQELEQELNQLKQAYTASPEMIKQFNSDSYKDYLRQALGTKKVMDYLKDLIIK